MPHQIAHPCDFSDSQQDVILEAVGSNAPALQRPKSWREYLVKFHRDLTRPTNPKGSWERESPQNSRNLGYSKQLYIW